MNCSTYNVDTYLVQVSFAYFVTEIFGKELCLLNVLDVRLPL